MDRDTLKTALVTKHLSKVMPEESAYSSFHSATTEVVNKATRFIASLNPDKRAIAIGRNDEIWRWESQASYSQDWSTLTRENNMHVLVLLAAACSPKKVLITNPDAATFLFAWQKYNNKTADITFVDSFNLHIYEKFFRSSNEIYDFPYSVVDVQDLETEAGQYDMVSAHFWDVVSDLDYLKRLVDAVAPGGTLVVNVANRSGKLYTEAFEMHSHYEMHEFLKDQENSTTVHIPSFYGTTVFTKH